MITEDATRLTVHAYFLKSISQRLTDTIPELPKEGLENLPLAVLLNLLFLLRGDWGSLGDYVTTQKGLRAVVGEKLFWNSPQPEEPGAPVGLVH
jgi:hypothetical protein